MRLLIVPDVVQQHVDDASSLASQRSARMTAPYATLPLLDRADRRLSAHLDGLGLAGEHASQFAESLLENLSPGALFVLAVSALKAKDLTRLERLIALAQAEPETLGGLLSAVGWMERPRLQGIVASLLRHPDGFRRMVGVAACALHRVDPGLGSGTYFQDPDPAVRARSLRTAGELGLSDLSSVCADVARGDAHPDPRFWAAWSAVLLGDRQTALDDLVRTGLSPGPYRMRSFRLALQAITQSVAHRILRDLAAKPQEARLVMLGIGIAGDPTYVPWLIKRMTELRTARLAAEAFTLITGVDLGADALDRPAPEGFESGPTDNPEDPNVEMDPDDGLPWPNADKIDKWWTANEARFQKGTRYFMGKPLALEHCVHVLKVGYQRQRILAAHYLCLLAPGTPLFNTSAPASRQRRLLAQMA